MPFDTPISVSYMRNDTYVWSYRLLLTRRRQLESQSIIRIDAPRESPSGGGVRMFDDPITIANRAVITVDIAPINGGQLRRPLIVAEGFDPGTILTPEVEGGETTFKDFDDPLDFSGNNLRNLIDPDRNARQYDIVYVDWINGTAPLQENSIGLEEVINWVNSALLRKQTTIHF